jgi:ATP-dependent Clp protease ATP-binding subunit ClpA
MTTVERNKSTMPPLSGGAKSIMESCKMYAIANHNLYLSTDHLMYVFANSAEEKKGLIHDVFLKLGIDSTNLLAEALRKKIKGNSMVADPTPTYAYNKVLLFAAEEMDRSGETKIDLFHILTGLIRYETRVTNSGYPSLTPRGKSGETQVDSLRLLAKHYRSKKA